MADFMEKPLRGVLISDDEEARLPLRYFHLKVIVEADPETYMPLPGDIPRLQFLLNRISSAVYEEEDPDRKIHYEIAIPQDVKDTSYLWLRYIDDTINYFREVANNVHVNAAFTLLDYDDLEHLRYYLEGVKAHHPDWRVAVFGAMVEDDVIRIANLCHTVGFATTVIARYCISNQTFVNLDNLAQYDSWVKTAGRGENEEIESFPDDWIDEDESGDDFDEDPENSS